LIAFSGNIEAQWLWKNHDSDDVIDFYRQYLLLNIEKDKAVELAKIHVARVQMERQKEDELAKLEVAKAGLEVQKAEQLAKLEVSKAEIELAKAEVEKHQADEISKLEVAKALYMADLDRQKAQHQFQLETAANEQCDSLTRKRTDEAHYLDIQEQKEAMLFVKSSREENQEHLTLMAQDKMKSKRQIESMKSHAEQQEIERSLKGRGFKICANGKSVVPPVKKAKTSIPHVQTYPREESIYPRPEPPRPFNLPADAIWDGHKFARTYY
jgi:hypothetical protein